MSIVTQIEELNNRIGQLKTKRDQLIGQRTSLQTRLKDEFGVKSVAQANAKVAELQAAIGKDRTELERLVAEAEAKVSEIENAIIG